MLCACDGSQLRVSEGFFVLFCKKSGKFQSQTPSESVMDTDGAPETHLPQHHNSLARHLSILLQLPVMHRH